LNSFEGTTLKAYKAGWSVFVDFLLLSEWNDIDFFNEGDGFNDDNNVIFPLFVL
jgi:hypothetical protein